MSTQYYVRESKAHSAVGGVACIIMLIFGLWFMTGDPFKRDNLSRNASPQLRKAFPELEKVTASQSRSAPPPVIILWVLFCSAGAIYSFWNIMSDNGPAYAVITEERVDTPATQTNRTAAAMRNLQELRDKNRISEEEFQSRRTELLDRLVKDPTA